MKTGRPTDYTEKLVAAAWKYANGGWIDVGDPVPTVAGMACEIGISRDTCYEWSKHEDKEFSDILGKIAQSQERQLVKGGLLGAYNAPISKMMLTKHGYSDATKSEISGPEGGAIPVEIKRTIVDPRGT
jgi:hypothetical protein